MYFWYHRNAYGDLWPVRSVRRPSVDSTAHYVVVGEVREIPENLERVPLLELCKRYPPPDDGTVYKMSRPTRG